MSTSAAIAKHAGAALNSRNRVIKSSGVPSTPPSSQHIQAIGARANKEEDYDPEMLEVAAILANMGSIHKEIELKKRRKAYSAAYYQKKKAEKEASGRVRGYQKNKDDKPAAPSSRQSASKSRKGAPKLQRNQSTDSKVSS